MTPRADYKKRLREHLKETKAHARLVARRIKALGGEAETVSLPVPESLTKGATGAKAAVQRAAAAAQAPLHAVRGTGQQERMLKNARTEYQDEAEEIATYRAIEALAKAVGDKETAKLAREIGREEKRMADFLVGMIDQLALDVVHDEVPVSEIGAPAAARRTQPSAGRQAAGHHARKATTTRAKAKPARAGEGQAGDAREGRLRRQAQLQPPESRRRSMAAASCAGRRWRAGSGRRERARAGRGGDVARAQLGAARRARQVAGDLAAAVAMADDDRGPGLRGVVAIAPLQQGHHHRPQVDALLGEPVLEARRAILVGHALEDALLDEPPEAVGQHVARDAEVALEVLEAAHAHERVAHDRIVQRSPSTSSERAIEQFWSS